MLRKRFVNVSAIIVGWVISDAISNAISIAMSTCIMIADKMFEYPSRHLVCLSGFVWLPCFLPPSAFAHQLGKQNVGQCDIVSPPFPNVGMR